MSTPAQAPFKPKNDSGDKFDPTKRVADIKQLFEASRKYREDNFDNELAEAYRAVKVRTEPIMVSDGKGGEVEDTNRTNVCMPGLNTMVKRKTARKKRQVSVAKAQQVWNKAARAVARGKATSGFKAQLVECVVDVYKRKSRKVRQAWPERKAHESPKAPKLRRLTKQLKAKGIIKLEECRRKVS